MKILGMREYEWHEVFEILHIQCEESSKPVLLIAFIALIYIFIILSFCVEVEMGHFVASIPFEFAI